jgi:hypothetical protein
MRARMVDGRTAECLSNSLAAGGLINRYVLDPCAQAARDTEHHQGQHANDTSGPISFACDEEYRCRSCHDARDVVGTREGRGRRDLGVQSPHASNDFAVGDVDTYNICNHYRFTLSRAIAPTIARLSPNKRSFGLANRRDRVDTDRRRKGRDQRVGEGSGQVMPCWTKKSAARSRTRRSACGTADVR